MGTDDLKSFNECYSLLVIGMNYESKIYFDLERAIEDAELISKMELKEVYILKSIKKVTCSIDIQDL
jgi:hypothetical protein